MGVLHPAPQYPVIDDDPGVWKAFQNFRTDDWILVAEATAVTTVVGYFFGRNTYMHRPTAAAAGIVGGLFGITFGLQNSMGRLMGLRENVEERQKANLP
jgi:NADH-ubiquinone oxidoreductase complex I, 21 kDa subunit